MSRERPRACRRSGDGWRPKSRWRTGRAVAAGTFCAAERCCRRHSTHARPGNADSATDERHGLYSRGRDSIDPRRPMLVGVINRGGRVAGTVRLGRYLLLISLVLLMVRQSMRHRVARYGECHQHEGGGGDEAEDGGAGHRRSLTGRGGQSECLARPLNRGRERTVLSSTPPESRSSGSPRPVHFDHRSARRLGPDRRSAVW